MEKRIGSGDKALDAVMISAALVMFVKTADVLGYFAPVALNGIFGFDVSYMYGMLNAAFVEITMLGLHFNHKAHNHAPAKIAKWTLLAISAVCQIFDGFISTGQLANLSDELKFVFQYGVPSITTIVVIMLLAIGFLPDEGEEVAHVGLKHRLPNWKRIWEGDASATQVYESTVETKVKPADNGGGGRNGIKNAYWPNARKQMQKSDVQFIAGGDIDEVMRKWKIARRTAYNWQTYAKRELGQ